LTFQYRSYYESRLFNFIFCPMKKVGIKIGELSLGREQDEKEDSACPSEVSFCVSITFKTVSALFFF
jgi:hypothetical protein